MPTDPIPLEDDPCDVIGKAMRGLGLSREQLAQKSGLSTEEVQLTLEGKCNAGSFGEIAPALSLSAAALVGLPSYSPDTHPPDGLYQFVSPFGHAGVNAYVIVHGHTASVFDTGTDASPIIEFLAANKLRPEAVYITHRHPDHTADIKSFGNTPIVYPESDEHGDVRVIGKHCRLTTLDVSGHLKPARAFLYQGLDSPVCIVGDSVFAGSMGGTPDPASYRLALKTAQRNLLTLPDYTILCPGHGPLTSVGMELLHNPFLNIV